MDNTIIVAIISSSTSILIAAFTYYLTKRHQIKNDWKEKKLNHYKKLLSSLSDLVIDGIDKKKSK